jgi:hypothetical protein
VQAQWKRYRQKHGGKKGDKKPNCIIKCKYCGKEFAKYVPPSNKKEGRNLYCSASCKSKDFWQDHKLTDADKTKICEYCGKEFVYNQNNKKQRFCSLTCMGMASVKQDKKNDRKLICKNCGKEFSRILTDAEMAEGKGIYCSRECHREYKAPELRNCIYCGKPFAPRKNKTKYCSSKCYALARRCKSTNPQGYISFTMGEPGDGERIAEHRYVMGQLLGRPLTTNEHVHHINGEKGDNRPENLELWITNHPRGIRFADANKSRKNEERLAHENYNLKKLLQETREELDNIQKIGTMPDKISTVSMALH